MMIFKEALKELASAIDPSPCGKRQLTQLN